MLPTDGFECNNWFQVFLLYNKVVQSADCEKYAVFMKYYAYFANR